MRDTFRLFFLTAIMLLLLTASVNTAFAQASLDQSLRSQYPKGIVLNVVTSGLTGTSVCDVYSQAAFKDGKLHAIGFVQKTALAAFKCEMQPIESGTQVNLTSMKVNENKVSFSVFQGQCAVPDCSKVVTGGVSAQVDFEFPKGLLATATFAQIQDTIGHVFSVANPTNAPAQVAQDAAPVSEPTPPAEEKSIDPGARTGAVSDQAKPVLDRAILFLGGVKNIRALKNIDYQWQMTVYNTNGNIALLGHSIDIYPGIRWEEFKMSFGQTSSSIESFFDGTKAWQVRNGTTKDLSEDEQEGYRGDTFRKTFNLLSLIGAPTVTYEGKNDANDVLLFRQENLSIRLHIDSAGKIIKSTYRTKTVEREITPGDYRDIGGVKISFKASVTENGQKLADSQVAEAIANTNPSLDRLAQKPGGQPVSASYLASIAPLQLPSFYVSTQSPDDHLQLNPDYSFQLREGGQPYHGTLAIRGNTLLLNISESNIQTSLTRQGHDLADSSGQTWSYREQTATTAPIKTSPARVRATGSGH